MSPVTDEHLPALFRAADRSSFVAQRRYLGFVWANLVLIVVGSVATSLGVASRDLRALLWLLGAAALVTGLGLTVFLLQLKPDEEWFGARAIAESVKTVAWLYMTRAGPYRTSSPDHHADDQFSRDLADILHERPTIDVDVAGSEIAAEEITPRMREVRSQDVEVRKAVYLRDRIRDQRAWYGERAQANARASSRWLVASGAAQLLGAVAAVAMVRWPDFPFHLASVFASIAAALVGWREVKQYGQLGHAYSLAAHELGLVEVRGAHVATEDELAAFVADAEQAISREHTMWAARRRAGI
jgi:hypothetical protein